MADGRGFFALPESVLKDLAEIGAEINRLNTAAQATLRTAKALLKVPDDYVYVPMKGFIEPEKPKEEVK